MGRLKFKQNVTSQSFDLIRTFASTGAVLVNRLVTLTANSEVKNTTGTSGRAPLGVALNTNTNGKTAVLMFGVASIVASTRAVAVGDFLRATSGAVSTGSYLGGTVRPATGTMSTASRQINVVGQALSSVAAGATGTRLVTVFVNPTVNAPSVI